MKGELTIFNIKTQFCTASAFEYFSDCTFENQVLVDGQAVLNPVNTCEECKCASGKIDCHQIPCPRPYCNSPRHGTCCQNNCDGETKSFFFNHYNQSFKSTSWRLNVSLSSSTQAAATLGKTLQTDWSFLTLLTDVEPAAAS